MSTMTEDRESQEPELPVVPRNAVMSGLLRCTRCKLNYASPKSTSALKLTYCSFLCELGDLGFSITGLEHMVLKPKQIELLPEPATAAIAP